MERMDMDMEKRERSLYEGEGKVVFLVEMLIDLKDAVRELGRRKVATYLGLSIVELEELLRNEKKFFSYVVEEGERVRRFLEGLKANGEELREILKNLLAAGVSAIKIARVLGYRGKDYGKFLEELRERKFALGEEVKRLEFLLQEVFGKNGGKEKEEKKERYSIQSVIESLRGVSGFCVEFFSVLLFCREGKASLKSVVRGIINFGLAVSEEFNIPVKGVFAVLCEVVERYLGEKKGKSDKVLREVQAEIKKRAPSVFRIIEREGELKGSDVVRARVCVAGCLKVISEVLNLAEIEFLGVGKNGVEKRENGDQRMRLQEIFGHLVAIKRKEFV